MHCLSLFSLEKIQKRFGVFNPINYLVKNIVPSMCKRFLEDSGRNVCFFFLERFFEVPTSGF